MLPVFVTRRVYATWAPGSPDLAIAAGRTITPYTVFAVVVSTEVADRDELPREVKVTLALSRAPARAVLATLTVTFSGAPAPTATGPTLDAALVAQALSLTATSNVSAMLPVFVTRNV
jgi:D-tyrosyl-tRNA(Tyr) deacylase